MLKFMFSKKTTKIDELSTIDLTVCSKCQMDGEDFFDFCGLLRKHELYVGILPNDMNLNQKCEKCYFTHKGNEEYWRKMIFKKKKKSNMTQTPTF